MTSNLIVGLFCIGLIIFIYTAVKFGCEWGRDHPRWVFYLPKNFPYHVLHDENRENVWYSVVDDCQKGNGLKFVRSVNRLPRVFMINEFQHIIEVI